MTEDRTEGRWIEFVISGRTSKTTVWNVVAKEGKIVLGEIKWFGRWRGYAFFPLEDMVFEQSCLRDIANFIEQENAIHRRKKQAERQSREFLASI